MKKAEILSAYFASLVTGSQASHFSQVPKPPGGGWGNEVPPTVSEEQVHKHLMKLSRPKCMGPDNRHPGPWESWLVLLPSHSPLYLKSHGGQVQSVPSCGKMETSLLLFKKRWKEEPENCRPVRFTSPPGNTVEEILMEAILRHIQDKKILLERILPGSLLWWTDSKCQQRKTDRCLSKLF